MHWMQTSLFSVWKKSSRNSWFDPVILSITMLVSLSLTLLIWITSNFFHFCNVDNNYCLPSTKIIDILFVTLFEKKWFIRENLSNCNPSLPFLLFFVEINTQYYCCAIVSIPWRISSVATDLVRIFLTLNISVAKLSFSILQTKCLEIWVRVLTATYLSFSVTFYLSNSMTFWDRKMRHVMGM
jgi:hypothetical protein